MMDLPRIFGDNGVFIEPDAETLAALDEPTRARLDGVRTAFKNVKAAQAAEQAALDLIADAQDAIIEAENYSKAHFKPQTQHDLWKDRAARARSTLGRLIRMDNAVWHYAVVDGVVPRLDGSVPGHRAGLKVGGFNPLEQPTYGPRAPNAGGLADARGPQI